MAIIIKTKEEIDILREGGKKLASVLAKVKERVVPGVTSSELDLYARELISEMGDTPAFLGYTPEGVSYPYPAALCVSINDEIVHGIPKEDVVIQNGDVVSIDLGLKHKGLFTDHAVTVVAGKGTKECIDLVRATEESLYAGIEQARVGNTVGDIGWAVESLAKERGYKVVKGLSGHGVGREIHEDPYIPNYGKKGKGEILREGMVIAIEPMLAVGTDQIDLLDDDYTYSTHDGSMAAHFEHTVYIGKDGPEILTEI